MVSKPEADPAEEKSLDTAVQVTDEQTGACRDVRPQPDSRRGGQAGLQAHRLSRRCW